MRCNACFVGAVLLCSALASQGACGSHKCAPVGVLDEGTLTVHGTSFAYRVLGDGEPCIWVAGVAAYTNVFPREMRALLRCAVVDARFWVDGASTRSGYSLGIAVDDVEAARSALGLERAVVVGHSIHGIIAQEYARRYPGRVKGVIVIGFGPALAGDTSRYWEEHASEERREADREWARRFSADSAPPGASDWQVWTYSYLARHARAWFNPRTDPSWLLDVADGEMNLQLLGELQESLSGINVMESQPTIVRPVFVAMGRFDFLVPPTVWKETYLQEDLVTGYVFEESGHFPMVEEPVLFAERLKVWLTELR